MHLADHVVIDRARRLRGMSYAKLAEAIRDPGGTYPDRCRVEDLCTGAASYVTGPVAERLCEVLGVAYDLVITDSAPRRRLPASTGEAGVKGR